MKCKYDTPWVGKCNKSADESGFCEEHKTHKCRCGNQADHGCSSAGSLVCGEPVCSDCGGYCNTHR